MTAAYILRERYMLGRVRTPYGRKMRYSPWTTVGRYSTLEEARSDMRRRTGLLDRAIFHRGTRIE